MRNILTCLIKFYCHDGKRISIAIFIFKRILPAECAPIFSRLFYHLASTFILVSFLLIESRFNNTVKWKRDEARLEER